MKYHLLLCLSIIAFAHGNIPSQNPFPHQQPNKETDESWGPLPETKPETNNQQSQPASGILGNKILTAKRKPLDPELADLVINMSEETTRELAQKIQECAKNSKKKCPSNILRTGAPGIGKTTYIQAVAQKAGITFVKINSAFVLDKYKDSGPVNLQAIFDSFLQAETLTLVAFDELHCLTDGHKNSNDPNPNTATALWDLMDQCAGNTNIILVGIMNNTSQLPEQIMSRFKKVYILKSADDVAQKQQILKYYLKKFKNSCDDKCQKTISNSIKTSEAREIEAIVESANETASLGKEEWQITQKDLEVEIKRNNAKKELQEKKEPDQMTKTLKAQERAANATTVNQYTSATVVGGGAIILAVEKKWGWGTVWKKFKEKSETCGKVAVVILKHTTKAGAEYCINGKIPNPKEIIKDMFKDECFTVVKAPCDKDQK